MERDNKGKFIKGHKKVGTYSTPKGVPSHMKGKHHTEEAKEKNRQKHLGMKPNANQLRGLEGGRGLWKGKKLPYPVWNKGTKGLVKAWNKGVRSGTNKECATCSDVFYVALAKSETRKYCSRKCQPAIHPKGKRLEWMVGEKNPLWKGGVTPKNLIIRRSIEYRLWRESVYARDNWTCQKCKDNHGKNLVAHHINNFAQHPELRFAIDNGITLCAKCHNLFHKKNGVKDNTIEQLSAFLTI